MKNSTKDDARAKPAAVTLVPFEQPPSYMLPDELPISVSEPKPRRNRRHDRAISRLPLADRLAEAQQSALISLSFAREFARDGQHQAADVKLEWAAFHGTRAAIFKAMLGTDHV